MRLFRSLHVNLLVEREASIMSEAAWSSICGCAGVNWKAS